MPGMMTTRVHYIFMVWGAGGGGLSYRSITSYAWGCVMLTTRVLESASGLGLEQGVGVAVVEGREEEKEEW